MKSQGKVRQGKARQGRVGMMKDQLTAPFPYNKGNIIIHFYLLTLVSLLALPYSYPCLLHSWKLTNI